MNKRMFFVLTLALSIFGSSTLGQDLRDLSARVNQTIGRVFVETAGGLSSGSGFVVDKTREGDLLFVTNAHVVEGYFSRILVGFLLDGKQPAREPTMYEGVVLANSVDQDLALLRLSPSSTPDGRSPEVIAMADGTVPQGATVAAFGYPGIADDMGSTRERDMFRSSVTSGVVSRTMETLNWSGPKAGLPVQIIQHEAALNAGNSGGPLINLCGVVVGVNTSVMAQPRGREIYQASSSLEVIKFLRSQMVDYKTASVECSGPIGSGVDISPVAIGLLLSGFIIFSFLAFVFAFRSSKLPPLFSKPIVKVAITDKNGRATSARLTRGQLQRGVTVGRSSRCAVTVSDTKVSARHLELRLEAGALFVRDLNSSNGTTVDGVRLVPGKQMKLSSKSSVVLGLSQLRVARIEPF